MEQLGFVGQLGAYGALTLVLVFLITAFSRGWIIPLSTHLRELEREKRLASFWEKTSEEKQKTIASLSIQNTAMLEATKTTVSVVEALPRPDKGGD